MKVWMPMTAAVLTALLLWPGRAAHASDDELYLPAELDEVVIYVHQFKPEDYEEGKKLVREGFGTAMKESGQTRRTYFIADDAGHEVIAVSFFKSGHSVDEWHDSMGRHEVLEQLEPLRREPLVVRRYVLHEVHNTTD